jgi:hypothetical protein
VIHDPLDKKQGLSLWVFIAGFAAAALLTLAAAVATSALHPQNSQQPKSSEAPVARG